MLYLTRSYRNPFITKRAISHYRYFCWG